MSIYNFSNFDDLRKNRSRIIESVRKNGYALLRGLLDPLAVRQCIPKIIAAVDVRNKAGTTVADRGCVRRNFIKWSVGGHSGSQQGVSRLMLTIYNPLFDEDLYGAHVNFRAMIRTRDILRNDAKQSFDDNLTQPSFNACRFQLYPRGGGFMSGHTDTEASKTAAINKLEMLQLLLFVTQRGIDFETGGAYVQTTTSRLDLESLACSGDIAVYDGSSFHGVVDVDPHLPLDTSKLSGRIVGLVTVYR